MNQYAYSEHWAPSGGSAQTAGERIEQLKILHGASPVLPAIVVEDARPESSILHTGYGFTWDRDLSALKNNLHEARMLMNTIRIVAIDNVQCTPHVAFINVIVGTERGYVGSVQVMSDDVLREQVLVKARADIRAWRRRYADLQELAELFAVIDSVLGSPVQPPSSMAAQSGP